MKKHAGNIIFILVLIAIGTAGFFAIRQRHLDDQRYLQALHEARQEILRKSTHIVTVKTGFLSREFICDEVESVKEGRIRFKETKTQSWRSYPSGTVTFKELNHD